MVMTLITVFSSWSLWYGCRVCCPLEFLPLLLARRRSFGAPAVRWLMFFG